MPSAYTHLYDHIIFSTKHRALMIDEAFAADLYPFLGGIARDLGCTAQAIGGAADHVHLLVRRKPNVSESELLRNLKSRSSLWANERVPGKLRWQEGYGAFSVSKSNIDEVVAYINNQREHHREMTYGEEFELFLKRNGIEFDPTELWRDD